MMMMMMMMMMMINVRGMGFSRWKKCCFHSTSPTFSYPDKFLWPWNKQPPLALSRSCVRGVKSSCHDMTPEEWPMAGPWLGWWERRCEKAMVGKTYHPFQEAIFWFFVRFRKVSPSCPFINLFQPKTAKILQRLLQVWRLECVLTWLDQTAEAEHSLSIFPGFIESLFLNFKNKYPGKSALVLILGIPGV